MCVCDRKRIREKVKKSMCRDIVGVSVGVYERERKCVCKIERELERVSEGEREREMKRL